MVLVVASSQTVEMYVYNDGGTYSCTKDSTLETEADIARLSDKGKSYYGLVFEHGYKNDFFFDPKDCQPFYRDKEEPIWYGRVEHLTSWNQNLFIYSYVTELENFEEETEFELTFRLNIRGKNHDSEDWKVLPIKEETESATCVPGTDLCTWFQVGYL